MTYSCCYKATVSLVSPAANMTDSVSQTWQEKHCDTVWFMWSNWPQSSVGLVEVVKPIKEHQIGPFGLTLSASRLSFGALWSRRTCGQKVFILDFNLKMILNQFSGNSEQSHLQSR